MKVVKLGMAVFVVLLVGLMLLSVTGGGSMYRSNSAGKVEPRGAVDTFGSGMNAPIQTLEVISVGVSLDTYRQVDLWRALTQQSAPRNIRESDPLKYPWSSDDKDGAAGDSACDALENAVGRSPMYWGFPSFYAGPPSTDPTFKPSDINPVAGLAGGAEGTGLGFHLFVTAGWRLSENPDELLEEAFAFFEKYPDLPYLVLMSEDSPSTRDDLSAFDAPLKVRNGHYVPERANVSAVLILARRERVEALRRFVWNDPENEYLQRNVRKTYYALQNSVPTPAKLASPDEFSIGRQPTVREWLETSETFSRNPFFKPKSGAIKGMRTWENDPPKDWKSTPWFPVPWNAYQMAKFDAMPSLGFVHRPVYLKFVHSDGRTVVKREERAAMLAEAWAKALQALPQSQREAGIVRVFASFDNQIEQRLLLERLIHENSTQGHVKIDTNNLAQFINTEQRLGNTGAATFFLQMGLGTISSYVSGGTSAAINLRDPDGASIVLISPPTGQLPSEEQRAALLQHNVSPVIDPGNYKHN